MSRSGIPSFTVLALLIATGLPAFAETELPAPETAALLQTLQQRRAKAPSLSADFTEEKTTRLLTKPLTSQGSLFFKVPNKFRRELKGANPSLTVSNGQKLWIYYPNFKEAELYTLGQRAFFDNAIAALTAGLNFEHVGEFYKLRAFRDGDSYRFELVPKDSGIKRVVKDVTVWLDSDFHILKTRATLPKGDSVLTTYRNQRPTTAPESSFEFTPPADTKISTPLGK